MNDQKIIVESLAMDLKRISIGFYRGSNIMAEKFKEEALKRSQELDIQSSSGYLQKLIRAIRSTLMSNKERISEDALMYSTLLQNYALQKMGSTNEQR